MSTNTGETTTTKPQLWRSRWAAIGAAVAVTLGGGGLFVANAAGGTASDVVLVDPARVLDTRDPNNLGLPGPFVSATSQKLQITGSIPTASGNQTVVPDGATGVLLNVTPVGATADGFISIRPGDAAGVATTSSLNFTTGDILPNAVQVALPTSGANAGEIDITFDAYGVTGPTTDVLIDVVGYTADATLTPTGSGFFTGGGVVAFATTATTVLSLDLPAGSFIVTAALTANNNDADTNSVDCDLTLGGTVIDSLQDGMPLHGPNTGPSSRENIALTGAGTLAAPGAAEIVCSAQDASGNWLNPTITAIQLGSLEIAAPLVAPLEGDPDFTD